MASLAIIDAYVQLDGNDISDKVESIDLDFTMETDDDTSMGDTGVVEVATRQNWSCSITAKQDYADSDLDEILYGILTAKAAVTLNVNPNTSTTSATNPRYSGSVVLVNYKPLAASHGQLARTPISLRPASALTRAEA